VSTPRNEKPLVLVADDDPGSLALVRFRFEREGYEVAAAGQAWVQAALGR
jgi:CheY-like chemotaxis protein